MSESAASLEELVDILATDGLELEYEVPESIVSRGEEAVALLGELILEEDYLDREWRGSEGWAPVHALYALAAIGHADALPAVMTLIRREPASEFVTEGWIVAVGCIGESAIDEITAFMSDDDIDPVLRGATATRGLLEIGERFSSVRRDIALELAGIVEDESTDDELRSYIAQSAARADDDDLQAAIDSAFEAGHIDADVFDRPALERVRGARQPGLPWAGPGAGRDPMEHFERDNLEALKLIIEVLPEDGDADE